MSELLVVRRGDLGSAVGCVACDGSDSAAAWRFGDGHRGCLGSSDRHMRRQGPLFGLGDGQVDNRRRCRCDWYRVVAG